MKPEYRVTYVTGGAEAAQIALDARADLEEPDDWELISHSVAPHTAVAVHHYFTWRKIGPQQEEAPPGEIRKKPAPRGLGIDVDGKPVYYCWNPTCPERELRDGEPVLHRIDSHPKEPCETHDTTVSSTHPQHPLIPTDAQLRAGLGRCRECAQGGGRRWTDLSELLCSSCHRSHLRLQRTQKR